MATQVHLLQLVTRIGTYLLAIGIVAVVAATLMQWHHKRTQGNEFPKRFPER